MENLNIRKKDHILIIRGIHSRTYDIFEEAVAELLNVDEKMVEYDKLPDVFIHPNEWPSRTNLCCAFDGAPFDNTPIFIPLTIKSDGSMKTLGCFCDYPCAVAYAMYKGNYDDEKIDELRKNICKLYKSLTGNNIEYILPADVVLTINIYGGQLTIQEWRNLQRKHIITKLPI